MNHRTNLNAYDSYEIFDDNESESKYRNLKLESCNKHVELIKKEFYNEKVYILELGSGNSKILINLEKNGLLNHGWGVEISKSRYNFATKWVNDLNIKKITNYNQNILNFDYNSIDILDICICVDLCFQFLDPIKKDSSKFVLEKVFKKLRPGGKFILELDYCGNIIQNLPYTSKIWEEFPNSDPWKYSLWDCSFDEQSKILNWKKTFISRENKYELTSIFLKIFSKEDIEFELNKIGFKNIRIYEDWNYTPFRNNFGEFIIIAEK